MRGREVPVSKLPPCSFVLMCDGATRRLVTTRESLLSRLSDVNSSSLFLCAMWMSFVNEKVDVYH